MPDEVDADLIVALLSSIRADSERGGLLGAGEACAVLVFLPGWEDIVRVRDAIERGPVASGSWLVLLHSMVAADEQRR